MPGGKDGQPHAGHALPMVPQLSRGGDQLLHQWQALRQGLLSVEEVRVPCSEPKAAKGRSLHRWPSVCAWPSVQASSRQVYSRSMTKSRCAMNYACLRERPTASALPLPLALEEGTWETGGPSLKTNKNGDRVDALLLA